MQRGGSLTGFRLVLANSNDNIGGLLGFSVQVVIDDLFGTIGVSGLGVESGARVVRHHPVTAAQGILHGPPGVILGSGLDIPDVPGVPIELTTLYGCSDCFLVTDRATSGVHQPRAVLEVSEQIGIDQPTGLLVKWGIDRDNVAPGDKFLKDDLSDWTVGSFRQPESP